MSVHNTIIAAAAKADFSNLKVRRTMPYKSNLKELDEYLKVAPSGNKGMIKHLIELYSEKKISNYKTVENVVTRLISKTKHSNSSKGRARVRQNWKEVQRRSAVDRPHPAADP